MTGPERKWSASKGRTASSEAKATAVDLANAAALEALIGADAKETLLEEIELLDGAGHEYDLDMVRRGELSPVFFGSALTNFGVELFCGTFCG